MRLLFSFSPASKREYPDKILRMNWKNFEILGSAHNLKEIKIKEKQGCSTIFLSPIFNIKKSKQFLDIHKFNFLTLSNKADFFALGGVNLKNLKKQFFFLGMKEIFR